MIRSPHVRACIRKFVAIVVADYLLHYSLRLRSDLMALTVTFEQGIATCACVYSYWDHPMWTLYVITSDKCINVLCVLAKFLGPWMLTTMFVIL